MSDTVGDLEFQKFGDDPEGNPAVRTLGGMVGSDGRELPTIMDDYFTRQEIALRGICSVLEKILNHQRHITGLGAEPSDLDDY